MNPVQNLPVYKYAQRAGRIGRLRLGRPAPLRGEASATGSAAPRKGRSYSLLALRVVSVL